MLKTKLREKSKKVLIIALISISTIILLSVIYYIIAFNDTNEIVKFVNDVAEGNISHEDIKGEPVQIYYNADRENFYSVDFELDRTFVLHNFSDGYIWAKYYIKGYDRNGELIFGFGSNKIRGGEIQTKWKIHKENGQWKIIEIDESAFK